SVSITVSSAFEVRESRGEHPSVPIDFARAQNLHDRFDVASRQRCHANTGTASPATANPTWMTANASEGRFPRQCIVAMNTPTVEARAMKTIAVVGMTLSSGAVRRVKVIAVSLRSHSEHLGTSKGKPPGKEAPDQEMPTKRCRRRRRRGVGEFRLRAT
ncbi:MAG TPA: hypothetical protein VNB06_02575, partial [Thermoanaerobaculia bacterium]|nr:hypothetical protein [Thermoanaerobaculia bacterium]